MSDNLKLSIKLTTEGGQIVVKDIQAVSDSVAKTNKKMGETEAAGTKAKKGMETANGGAGSLNKSLTTLRSSFGFLTAALGFAGGGIFLKSAIDEAEQLERNLLRTESVIKSMGGAAGFSTQQLHEQARRVAATTLQSTEGVMRAQQVMMTYRTITGETFTNAISLATDLATLMGGNLQQSVEQLSRALDDPDKGLQALAKSGYRFSEAQQTMWADMANTGRMAEAQSQIIAELRTQVGGLAEKEALGLSGAKDTYAQSMQEAKIAIDKFLGSGEALSDFYKTAAGYLDEFASQLSSGEMSLYLQSMSLQFKAWAGDIDTSISFVSGLMDNLFETLSPGSGGTSGVLSDAFLNFGANIRAAVQLAVVEILGLVDKSRVLGRAVAHNLDPRNWFGDEKNSDYWKAEFAQVESVTQDMTDEILNSWNSTRAASANLREEAKKRRAEWEAERAAFDAYTPSLVSGFEQIGQGSNEAAYVIARNAEDFLAKLNEENRLLQIRLEKGELVYEREKALSQLKTNDPAVAAQIDASLAAQKSLNEQMALLGENASGSFNEMLDGMSALSGAGGDMGDILTQSFGRVAQQLDAMTDAQLKYNKQLDVLKKKRSEIKDSDPEREQKLIDIRKTEARLASENTQAQIGQFAAIAGAASQMFGEQSKEREALHKAEIAFSAIEMAMTLQRTGVKAVEAITSAFSAPFPLNFAAGAAMIGIMAGLGVFSGSSSSSGPSAADKQASQGTGTVLGDSSAKSESIANVFGRIEDLELDQYIELRAINSSVKALNAGIANLAVSLVRSFGSFGAASYSGSLGEQGRFEGVGLSATSDFQETLGGSIGNSIINGLSKTNKKLLDSGISFETQNLGEIIANGLLESSYYSVIETTKRKLWGAIKSTSSSTEFAAIDESIQQSFAEIYIHIGGSVKGALDVLGLDAAKALESYVINLPELSFKDLSGAEIQEQLEAIFSSQADLITQYVVPGIEQYQQMGEGLFETLIRVAQEQSIVNSQLSLLGLELERFGDISAETKLQVTQSLLELMGGIEKFQDMTGAYIDGFYSDADKFSFLTKSVTGAFDELGISVPAAKAEFKALVGSIDITTDAGAALFNSLMQLAPALSELLDASKQIADFENGFQAELAALDMSPFENSMTELNAWYDEQITAAHDMGAETVFIEKLYARKRADIIREEFAALTSDHSRAVEALVKEYEQLFKSMDSASDGIANAILAIQRQMPGWSESGYQGTLVKDLQSQLGTGSTAEQINTITSLQKAISGRYQAELADSKKLADAAQQRYQTELQAINAMRQAAQQLLQAADAMLLSEASPALLGSQLAEAQKQFDALFKSASGGDAAAAQQLSGVGSSYLSIAKDFYAQGSNEYAAIFNQIEQSYRGIGLSSPAEPPVPAAIRQYQARDTELQTNAVEQLEHLQSLLETLRADEQASLDIKNMELVESYRAATDELLAAQQDQITATLDAAGLIVDAINTNTANDNLIVELQQQRADAIEQNKTLVAELNRMRTELARVTANAYNNQRVG